MTRSGLSREQFGGRVADWATRLRVTPRQVRVQAVTCKWGSCTTRGRVSFARALLSERPAFRDFVVVHELLHLRVRNHGRLFQTYLNLYVPGWRRYARRSRAPSVEVRAGAASGSRASSAIPDG